MIRLAAVFSMLSIIACPASAQDRNPQGVWLRDDGNARVRIAPCGPKICATNLWIRDTSKGENVGDKLVMTLDRTTDRQFKGTAYDPKRDRTYDITVIVSENRLVTRGCILAGLLCRDVNWTPAYDG